MPKHLWSMFCSDAILDSDTKNVSLLKLIEQVNIVGLDQELDNHEVFGTTMPWALVSLWQREEINAPDIGRARVQLCGEYDIDLSNYERVRHFTRQNVLPVSGYGSHKFVIDIEDKSKKRGWKKVAEIPFEVKRQQEKPGS